MRRGRGISFRRPCKDCEKPFRPTGKFGKYCEKCLKKPEHTIGRKYM